MKYLSMTSVYTVRKGHLDTEIVSFPLHHLPATYFSFFLSLKKQQQRELSIRSVYIFHLMVVVVWALFWAGFLSK